MDNNIILNNRLKNIESLYNMYPMLKKFNMKNNGIIYTQAIFINLYANEYVFGIESACQGAVFVIKGTVKIVKVNKDRQETNLYTVKQGEFCHEAFSSLLNLEPLKITCKAIKHSRVCIIPFDIIKKYFFKDNEILLHIYKDLYKKFNIVMENKEDIIREPVELRVVRFLVNKNKTIIYVTHNELAFEVDSAREVVSRILESIKKRGFIELERGKIIILKDLSEILK